MKTSHKYPADVPERQWEILCKSSPPSKTRGRRPIDRRWVLNAIFQVVRSGRPGRLLPRDFPCWNTVYGVWIRQGVWQRINASLNQTAPQGGRQEADACGISFLFSRDFASLVETSDFDQTTNAGPQHLTAAAP